MNLHLADAKTLLDFRKEISNIGSEVNDHTLFDRIQEACLKKRAFLFVSEDGFMVLLPDVDQGVLVWAAYSFKKTNRASYIKDVEQLARDIDVSVITFWSNRRGFHKIAPKLGFTATPSTWMGTPITIWTKQL